MQEPKKNKQKEQVNLIHQQPNQTDTPYTENSLNTSIFSLAY